MGVPRSSSNLQQKMQDDQKQHEVILQQNNEDHKRELSKANAQLVKEYNRGREEDPRDACKAIRRGSRG